VDYLEQFVIPFGGLKPGHHQFDFDIDGAFFEKFESSEIHDGKIRISVDLEKEERMMVLNFTISGNVTMPCDRCNVPFDLPVSGHEMLILKLGDHFEEESETVVLIPEAERKINISNYIYEYTHLLLPARRVHPDDENGNSSCDPEVLKKLESFSAGPVPDGRWDALKQLKTKK
jgi:uncharacterized protein